MNNLSKKIIIFFLVSRAIMVLSGFRILVDYDYMHFHDINLLQHNFWETIFYTHSFTPWINIFTGFVLQFPEYLHPFIYQVSFYGLSVTALLMFSKLLKRLDISDKLTLGVVIFFSLTPPYIYFEHFYIYTFPAMAILLVAAESLMQAIDKDTFRSWLLFFTWCVLLSFVRTTFHLVWLIAILGGVLLVQKKVNYKIIFAFLIPTAVLLLWYLKNLLLFGFFGISSWAGFNLSYITVRQLDDTQKTTLINEGIMSPLIKISVHNSVQAYSEYVDIEEKTGIEVLDAIKRSNGQPNYNHKKFTELSKLKMKDNITYLKLYPKEYAFSVMKGFLKFFRPTSTWHPHDQTASPHLALRKKIGAWEKIYNTVFHSLPIKNVGLYTFFILLFIWLLITYVKAIFRGKLFSSSDKLIAFTLMNIFFVATLSCLVTSTELARYRFMIEPFIWILSVVYVSQGIKRYRNRLKGKVLA